MGRWQWVPSVHGKIGTEVRVSQAGTRVLINNLAAIADGRTPPRFSLDYVVLKEGGSPKFSMKVMTPVGPKRVDLEEGCERRTKDRMDGSEVRQSCGASPTLELKLNSMLTPCCVGTRRHLGLPCCDHCFPAVTPDILRISRHSSGGEETRCCLSFGIEFDATCYPTLWMSQAVMWIGGRRDSSLTQPGSQRHTCYTGSCRDLAKPQLLVNVIKAA
jgi:hypothetical protein